MSKLKNAIYQRMTESCPHLPPTCSSLRFIAVDGFHRRDFRKLEGLSIDNDNAEDEKEQQGQTKFLLSGTKRRAGRPAFVITFSALCETKRSEMKINED